MHRFVLSPLRDGEERKREEGEREGEKVRETERENEGNRDEGWWYRGWLTVVFNAASSTTPGRSLSYFPPPPTILPLVARLAILDALRRPRERDSYGEIELNLEMNIESNELSTYQPANQPPPL